MRAARSRTQILFAEVSVNSYYCRALIGCLLLAVAAFAQATGGSLSGVVTDASGAAVAGVEITAQNEQNGRQYRAVSSKEGLFAFPDLDTGRYTITAQQTTISGVAVEVATRYTLNLTLHPNEGTRAPNMLLEGASSEIGTYVQPKFF